MSGGRWYRDWCGRCRERLRRGGFATAEQACQAGRAIIAADQNDPVSMGYTLARWLRHWLGTQHQLRSSTRETYADHVRLYLIPYLGRIELAELAVRDIARMFAVLAKRRNRYGEPIASSTLHRIRATLPCTGSGRRCARR
ncbi:hypothetical protein GCM10020216_037310 [Nonomuraea helvata]